MRNWPIADFRIQGVDGTTINLTDLASPVRMGRSPFVFGDSSPEVATEVPLGLQSGDILSRRPRDGGRLSVIPFTIVADDQQHAIELVEQLAAATHPVRGDVLLVATRPDGTERGLRLLRTQRIQPDFGLYDGRTLEVLVSFRSLNPYWQALVPVVSSTPFPITGSGLTDTPWDADIAWDADVPWDGWQSTGAQGQVAATIDSVGTAPSWPRFEITGPFTGAEMVNASNAQRPLIFTGDVAAGETLVIETRERSRSARVGTRSVLGGFDLAASDFWHLVPGENSITVAVGGFITTETALTMSFVPQSLTC